MKRRTIALLLAGMMLLLSGCGSGENTGVDAGAAQTSGSAEDTEQTEGGQQDGDQGGSSDVQEPSGTVTEGTEEYRGFTLDNVLHSENNGDAQMPVVSSRYWNMVHGSTPEDVRQDLEGLQVMRTLAENMAWLLRCIDVGRKAGVPAPVYEEHLWTNFIR